ncbi:hypothetical protein CQA53_10135 [Helicobacter didelphidarum]|uniref:Uncharacterized protein n=1 Tax=Helicobacter didelphidarum TaxID=2040648 RepID=A0A3D8IA90_9HELI|nr:hypothetical protein [Helicobacter didelphidarum]RDU61441.1 hypothetical protein CQA53_10135 [Helicobacter didelphidarum]
MRMIYLIIGILIVVLFNGCVNLMYFDPQYYKYRKLFYKESGTYIYDEKLYKEAENLRKKNGGMYVFVDFTPLLSNGYELMIDMDKASTQPRQIDSRIRTNDYLEHYFIDSQGKRHIISYRKGFYFRYYGLWLDGDEGGGFHWHTTNYFDNGSSANTFILKDNKWQQVEN